MTRLMFVRQVSLSRDAQVMKIGTHNKKIVITDYTLSCTSKTICKNPGDQVRNNDLIVNDFKISQIPYD